MIGEEAAQAIDFMQLAGQYGRQVEAEAVNVHLLHPIPQAVHDELDSAAVEHVEAVARNR